MWQALQLTDVLNNDQKSWAFSLLLMPWVTWELTKQLHGWMVANWRTRPLVCLSTREKYLWRDIKLVSEGRGPWEDVELPRKQVLDSHKRVSVLGKFFSQFINILSHNCRSWKINKGKKSIWVRSSGVLALAQLLVNTLCCFVAGHEQKSKLAHESRHHGETDLTVQWPAFVVTKRTYEGGFLVTQTPLNTVASGTGTTHVQTEADIMLNSCGGEVIKKNRDTPGSHPESQCRGV